MQCSNRIAISHLIRDSPTNLLFSVTTLVDQLTSMERIANTPIPTSCMSQPMRPLTRLTVVQIQTEFTSSNVLHFTFSLFLLALLAIYDGQ